jgi:hypothetical protein
MIPAAFFAASLLLLAGAAFYCLEAGRRLQKAKRMIEAADAVAAADDRVDIWDLQEDVMRRSRQRIPAAPRLHNGVILYGALDLEELGEMFQHLGLAVAHHCDVTVPRNVALSIDLRRHGELMRHWSKAIRNLLKEHDIGDHRMLPGDAKALFDDTCDLSVTNAGFCNSAGFPGAKGYAETQNSNLSKANPETGLIDKEPDGKWIKGPNYVEPDLLGILVNEYPGWAHQMRCAGMLRFGDQPTDIEGTLAA